MFRQLPHCGVYAIRQIGTDRCYIGSSSNIPNRWCQHRLALRKGSHHSPFLQNAWNKHGAESFEFSVLKPCAEELLFDLEQQYIDSLRPVFNVCPTTGPYAIRTMSRLRAAKITHCPRNHPYDYRNTYHDRNGKRVCRQCNGERVANIYATQTDEERTIRLAGMRANYQENHDERLANQLAYGTAHREEKQAYDREHRAESTARKRQAISNETPKQRERRLANKRASHARNREHDNARSKLYYQRTKLNP